MEKVLSDFSAGMNAQAAVDKLQPNECLLAENIRLDESGNIQSAGAYTRQNSILYGNSGRNIHSLYWNPSLGAVSGIGPDMWQGTTLGGQGIKLAGVNNGQQKCSFASAPGRVYFDAGSIGYWSDMTNMVSVDWPPPIAAGAAVTGPNSIGTATQTGFGVGTNSWNNVANIGNTSSNNPATVALGTFGFSEYVEATMTTNSFAVSGAAPSGISVTLAAKITGTAGSNGYARLDVALVKNGAAQGTGHSQTITVSNIFTTYTFGGSSDLWGLVLSTADVNAGNFGIQVNAVWSAVPGNTCTFSVYGAQLSVYQGAGFGSASGAGGTLTGTYQWKVTFVAANGEESDASNDSGLTTLAGAQGTLTGLPLGDVRTVARNVYRIGRGTSPALTAHYLVGTIRDNVTTTYSDNQTDIAALNQGTILAGDIPGDYPNSRLGSQNVRFPVLHYDRVFWVVPGTNKVIWSKPLNGFAYPSINFFQVGDSKPVTRLVSIFGELIIFKTDSIWRLTGTDESSFDLSQTPSSVGTDESFAVFALPDKVIFHNRWGFWLFNGYTSQPVTPKMDLWQRQEDRTNKSLFGVNGFHPPEVNDPTVPTNFEIVGNSEKFYLAYAEASQPSNNAVLRFDLKAGNITKRSVSALSLAIDPANGFVYMGDGIGFVSLLDDFNGTNAGGANVNFDYQHGYTDLERGSNKALWALEFYLNTNGQSLTPSVYYDNGLASETLAPITTTGLQRVVRTMEATQGRKCQNWSWRLNGALTKVNSSGTPSVQIVHVKMLYDTRTGRARTGQT